MTVPVRAVKVPEFAKFPATLTAQEADKQPLAETSSVPALIVNAPPVVMAAPRVLVPVPELVMASNVIDPEFKVASPLPEKVVVLVPPMVKVPTLVNNVPEVPVMVRVELLISKVPLDSMSTLPVVRL